MNISWKDYIASTADVLYGKPRIQGTRIPVSLILGYLSARRARREKLTTLNNFIKVLL